MAPLSAYGVALATLDECADHGVEVEVDENGLPAAYADCWPGDLRARLAALLGSGPAREALDTHRALRGLLAAPTRALRELLTWPVGWSRMPVGYALTFERGEVQAFFTTSGPLYAQAVKRGPTFVAREFDVVAQAYELGRAGPVQLDQWLAAKSRGPWVLSPEQADVEAGGAAPMVCFGELLEGLGARAVSLEMVGG